MKLFKFYGPERARQNLRAKRLKVSTISDLNDPFEFNAYRFDQQRTRHVWKQGREKLFQDLGIISFSKSWHNPVLWSHYAENHTGLALGFEVHKPDTVDVTYSDKRVPFRGFEKPLLEDINRVFSEIIATKFKHWEYENEVRMPVILSDAEKENGLYFHGFSDSLTLTEVVIGPLSKLSASEIREDLGDYSPVKIITSRLALSLVQSCSPKAKRSTKTTPRLHSSAKIPAHTGDPPPLRAAAT